MPEIKVSKIHEDKRHGAWFAFGTERGWVEIRVTPTGLIRSGEPQHKAHPYFTVKREEGKNDE